MKKYIAVMFMSLMILVSGFSISVYAEEEDNETFVIIHEDHPCTEPVEITGNETVPAEGERETYTPYEERVSVSEEVFIKHIVDTSVQ